MSVAEPQIDMPGDSAPSTPIKISERWPFLRSWSVRRLIVAAMILVAVLFVYDLVWIESRNDDQLQFPTSSTADRATAAFVIRNVKHDSSTGVIVGDVDVEVRSVDNIGLTEIVFSLRTNNRGLRDWVLVPSARCERLRTSDHDPSVVPYQTSGRTMCRAIEVSDVTASREIWYPFDAYITTLDPRVCVNTRDVVACGTDTALSARPTAIHAQPAATDLSTSFSETSPRSPRLTVQRRFFLRMVSILCLVMSLIFVTYLVRVADPKETMTKSFGIFAALWGFRALIVPETVNAFPTVVDFTILIIFCIVFALVLLRASEQPRRQRTGGVPE